MYELRVLDSIQQFSEADWAPLTPKNFPFARYSFLLALENGKCLGPRTGWNPKILSLWREDQLVGASLWFEKNNSYGEYIFDFAWAGAYERHGLSYYPKIVAAIPFTPATGPKLLVHMDLAAEEELSVKTELVKGAVALAEMQNFSSCHALFIPQQEEELFLNQGFLLRSSFQYHFRPEKSDGDFADFLARLRSKRRKEIRREREQVREQGIRILRLTQDQLQPEHAQLMYGFYLSTVRKMGGFDYLSFEFFQEIFATMKGQILFVLALSKDGEPVAGALNFYGDDTLYGRHWGCHEQYKFLHFEVCYYQGIEFCLERRFSLLEAGAQGEHKFQRGFLPELTRSAHWISDPRFQVPIRNFIVEEKNQIEHLFDSYAVSNPYRTSEN